MTKEILWMYQNRSIVALIPKRRGDGYLRKPYGHHRISGLEDIRNEIGMVDLFGLEGHLEICVDKADYEDANFKFGNKVVSHFSDYYGFPCRRVEHNEFWANHPIKT